jgi:excisionase family DNA binding protein
MTDSLSDRVTDVLTPAEAAVRLGVSERTVWRRIKAGKLEAEHTLEGVRVLLSDAVSVDDRQASVALSDNVSDRATDSPQPELMKALEMVSELTRRNEQLAGQVGFLQAKMQDQERQIALLMAPKDEPAPEPPAQPEPKVSWWRRLFGQ